MTNLQGDCFVKTTAFVVGDAIREFSRQHQIPLMLNQKSPYRICHGLPIGTGGIVKGKRYWHAWVEVDFGGGPYVIEKSNGKDHTMTRETYYELGSLDEEHVWRFTPAEALKLYRRLDHCGPWIEGWEQMEDGLLSSQQLISD